jgi:glycosyltransferase involved in cell wall biosynthesis
MKKIGLYLDSPVQGGTFQYNLSILDAIISLPNNQFNYQITYTSDLWGKYLKEEKIPATRINRTLLSRTWFQIRSPLWFWRRFCVGSDSFSKSFISLKCDLWIFPSQDIWTYSLPVKSLGTVHDLMHRYERSFPEAGSKKEYLFRETHYKRTCKFSKGILVDSQLGKEQLMESYIVDESKIFILPFIAPKYIYEENSQNVIDYKLPNKYVFYPAQFWEHKNHKGLVNAISLIAHKLPDLKMVFVGSPNNSYNKLRTLINRLQLQDNFIFLDHVPDNQMRNLYLNARALIMPTFFGPTNIPPLEAFATECPVAVSNVYAMPEQIGEAGLVFDPNSYEQIADVIYRLWTDDNLVSDLINKGREKNMAWGTKQFSKELFSIIKRVLQIT